MPRRPPPLRLQASILDAQRYRCGYCTLPFGTIVIKRRRTEITHLEWDHFCPFSYIRLNPYDNWIAACSVCNRLKAASVFATLEEAQLVIMQRWEAKKYIVRWMPKVSQEDDPDAWTTEYQALAERVSHDEETETVSTTVDALGEDDVLDVLMRRYSDASERLRSSFA